MNPAARKGVPWFEGSSSPPWSEGNSRCHDHNDLLKMIVENHKLSFAQASTLSELMKAGEEVSASYGHPSLADGVRVRVHNFNDGLSALGKLGFRPKCMTACEPMILCWELRR